MTAELEIHYSEDWAALYVNGTLDIVGDSYLAEERAFDILGVNIVQDPAFMRGQTARDGVAQTLDEVADYKARREEVRRKVAEMENEIADRQALANSLKEEYKLR